MRRFAGVVMAVAGLAMVVMAGQGQAQAQGADDPVQAEMGASVYAASCAGCHGTEGTGVAGRGRPLLGIADQGDRGTHIASVTDGKGGMPAFGSQLSSEEIEQAISYVRLTFVEAAAESGDGELAETGFEATGLAVVGFTMLVGGIQLVVFSKRRD